MILIYYLVAAFGLAYLVGHSRASMRPREMIDDISPLLADLLECPMCFGFYEGFFTGAVYFTGETFWFWKAISLGCFTSGSNFILGRLTGIVPRPPTT